MKWLITTLSSSLGKKVWMALTGLFLCSFLVIHLIGNFQLIKSDDGYAFNKYAMFMTTFPPIKIISYALYTSILLHVIYAIVLTVYNKKARPQGYTVVKNSSAWNSRNMGILGTAILLFLVFHLYGFWAQYHWGQNQPYVKYTNELLKENSIKAEFSDVSLLEGKMKYKEFTTGEASNPIEIFITKDLYKIVYLAYKQWWIVLIYVLAMIPLAFHLLHGFQSAFQTLGLNHKKYTPIIKSIGVAFSILIPAGFALIPIWVFLK